MPLLIQWFWLLENVAWSLRLYLSYYYSAGIVANAREFSELVDPRTVKQTLFNRIGSAIANGDS